MVGLIPELDLEDLDQASKTKNSKDPPAPVDPRDWTFADSFLDFESGLRIYQALIWQKQGRSRLRWLKKSLLERQMATADGYVPIGCVEKEECEISENLSCSIEEEQGKVSLLGGCDQNSVLGDGNCMKSEVSRNSGGGEPENNENGNEISKSKIEDENAARKNAIEDENAARKNAILFRKQKLVSL
ncbi:PREDICTED: H/ACA ribonucleo complex non-core subunit [Prunus dulcis]|uniref:PREDICTED: H/ACA ribonucleo complex non-core subunit n=1 Tax=Prunus dulcis TaxID=3755 RepID=A0A5E4F461_PRUDU|nr:hypothetical protein L3X38_026902 [Prunus dulcis]VVA22895.1 PREDICTED: H/ACA ribonucleo complex non-core subunit [Prunus dulcis]